MKYLILFLLLNLAFISCKKNAITPTSNSSTQSINPSNLSASSTELIGDWKITDRWHDFSRGYGVNLAGHGPYYGEWVPGSFSIDSSVSINPDTTINWYLGNNTIEWNIDTLDVFGTPPDQNNVTTKHFVIDSFIINGLDTNLWLREIYYEVVLNYGPNGVNDTLGHTDPYMYKMLKQ